MTDGEGVRIEDVDWHDAFLEAICLVPRQGLTLDVVLTRGTQALASGRRRLSLRFAAIENWGRVESFFFTGPLKGAESHLDTLLELRHTPLGWSMEFTHLGRVAIRTAEYPTVTDRDAEGR